MSLTRPRGLAAILLLLLALVGLEWLLRQWSPSPYQRDDQLGWRLQRDFAHGYTQRGLDGSTWPVTFSTDADGFRTFGDTRNARTRVLVIGDSFTAHPYASNDRMWYAEMARQLAAGDPRAKQDVAVWAAGGGGWGSYQSLLLAGEAVGHVAPTLFILQFCGNDFANNLYAWEREGIVRGQYLRRPFARLEGGELRPFFADGLAGTLWRSALGDSRVFNRADTVIGALQYAWHGGYMRILPPAMEEDLQRQAFDLTREILLRLRAAVAAIPALMVNCSESTDGPNRDWQRLATEAGFIPVAAPSEYLAKATAAGRRDLHHADGAHLSEEGNREYGALAAKAIRQLGIPLIAPPATPAVDTDS